MEHVREGVNPGVGKIHEPAVHPDLLDVFVRHGTSAAMLFRLEV
jgi:hypothetical protein